MRHVKSWSVFGLFFGAHLTMSCCFVSFVDGQEDSRVVEDFEVEWIKQLATEKHEEATIHILEMGARKAIGPLVNAIHDEPQEISWKAIGLISRLVNGVEKRDSSFLGNEIAKLIVLVRDLNGQIERRTLAVLCLAMMARFSEKAVKPVISIFDESPPTELHIAATLCLGRIGRTAARPLGRRATKNKKGKNYIPTLLAVSSLAIMGPEATSAKGALLRIIENDIQTNISRFLSYKVAEMSLRQLKGSKSKLKKALLKRASFEFGHDRGRPSMMGANPDPALLRAIFVGGTGINDLNPYIKLSYPQDILDPNGGTFTFDDILHVFATHLSAELVALEAELESDSKKSYADWIAKIEGLVGVAYMIDYFDYLQRN